MSNSDNLIYKNIPMATHFPVPVAGLLVGPEVVAVVVIFTVVAVVVIFTVVAVVVICTVVDTVVDALVNVGAVGVLLEEELVPKFITVIACQKLKLCWFWIFIPEQEPDPTILFTLVIIGYFPSPQRLSKSSVERSQNIAPPSSLSIMYLAFKDAIAGSS